eukprot:TRINITY_DN39_c0_g1_i2.p1 TRINITY_DN39_c0_g1~~TRINITY_DN39_c0_g1_i2.p1  ORF type:complete len:564 (+),score=121.71 TRINITY_DN39_c0_g1_i2:176-1693(+)
MTYRGADPMCDYLPLLANPDAMLVLGATSLSNEYTVWNNIMVVVSTVSTTLETPFFIRMAAFHSVLPYNALTAFYSGVSPIMADSIPNLFPFGSSVPTSFSNAGRNTTINRNIAVAYAMQRLVEYFYPQSVVTGVSGILTGLGQNPAYTGATNVSDPRDIGNIAAAATISWSKQDGFNFESTEWTQWKHPYSDNSGFIPTNTAYQLSAVNQWQPLLETRNDGSYVVQTLVGAECGKYGKTVGLNASQLQAKDGSSYVTIVSTGAWNDPLNSTELAAYKNQSDFVLGVSANLTEQQKMIAEFFDRKALSFGTAPFASYLNATKMNSLIKYLAIDMHHIAIHDALIVAWKEKIKLNKVRPISAIRYLYGKKNVTAYGGPYSGTKTYSGAEWQGYLRTMPHSEFPSGTCCVCVAFAEWMEGFFGTPGKLNNFTWTFGAGCSIVEPNVVPSSSFTKVWNDKESFIQECCASRVNAGVHFKPSCDKTAQFCRGVGAAAWSQVSTSIRKFM